MGKPASGKAYVESGDVVPVVALAAERFPAPFDVAPTMPEAGFALVEFPVWRGVIASKNMSPEAQQFWNDAFRKVTETDRWKKEYLERFLLAPNFNDLEQTRAAVAKTDAEIKAAAAQ
jgi:putative tricarboxylic transport membrane protein